jgi:hypothetical protein
MEKLPKTLERDSAHKQKNLPDGEIFLFGVIKYQSSE